MGAYMILAENWVAETQKTFTIAMGKGEIEGETMIFVLKAVPHNDDDPFTFKSVLSKKLVEEMGFGFDADGLERISPTLGKKALADLQRRLNGGHDYNFDGNPYIKNYTLRDKKDFEAIK